MILSSRLYITIKQKRKQQKDHLKCITQFLSGVNRIINATNDALLHCRYCLYYYRLTIHLLHVKNIIFRCRRARGAFVRVQRVRMSSTSCLMMSPFHSLSTFAMPSPIYPLLHTYYSVASVWLVLFTVFYRLINTVPDWLQKKHV